MIQHALPLSRGGGRANHERKYRLVSARGRTTCGRGRDHSSPHIPSFPHNSRRSLPPFPTQAASRPSTLSHSSQNTARPPSPARPSFSPSHHTPRPPAACEQHSPPGRPKGVLGSSGHPTAPNSVLLRTGSDDPAPLTTPPSSPPSPPAPDAAAASAALAACSLRPCLLLRLVRVGPFSPAPSPVSAAGFSPSPVPPATFPAVFSSSSGATLCERSCQIGRAGPGRPYRATTRQ